METILHLKKKEGSLTISDAGFILQFIQEQTAPLLSLRTLCKSDTQTGVISRTQQIKSVAASSCVGSSQLCPRACASSHKKNSVIQNRLDHKNEPSKGSTININAGDGTKLDFTSLEDFPPISSSSLLQEKR